MRITGSADGSPQKAGVALVDVPAGLFASVGILTALVHRAETGLGQRVEVNLLSSLLAALVNQGASYTAAGVIPPRMGNRHPSIAPYELLRCSDRELVVAVGTDRQFAALCTTMEARSLASDPRFATNSARVASRYELVELLENQLASRTADHWAEALTRARVPAGVVNDIGAAFQLAERLGLNPTAHITDESGGGVNLTRSPIRSLTHTTHVSACATESGLGSARRILTT